ncbi:MAG: hypothetical protein R3B72_42425 [Polyangiaceae bacterium]
MKTRVTFRVADDIAEALRDLPNQTHFVEMVLREALGMTCPVCGGEGRVQGGALQLPNFKAAALPTPDRETALQLRALVHLARQLAATNVDLSPSDGGGALGFALRRHDDVLLAGEVCGSATSMRAVH